jgi:hypothetical protein
VFLPMLPIPISPLWNLLERVSHLDYDVMGADRAVPVAGNIRGVGGRPMPAESTKAVMRILIIFFSLGTSFINDAYVYLYIKD